MLIREHRPHLEIWRGDYSWWVLIYFSRRAAEINLAAPLQGVKGGFPGGWVSSVGHYCIGSGAGRNGLSNWRGDMEPLHVFTMDVSWGGWKAVSGLKEIGSGSWLRTDHTVAPQMNGILQKFSSHAGSITGHQCCGCPGVGGSQPAGAADVGSPSILHPILSSSGALPLLEINIICCP